MRISRPLLAAVSVATIALMGLGSAGPALAATPVVITDRETVQAYLSPTGSVKVARVFDQVTATGSGRVEIANPVGTDGLRNLDGLSGVSVKDGKAVSTIDVNGQSTQRTVSTFDKHKLPVTIKAHFTLDGKTYDNPEDLVGKSGKLTVSYRISNITSTATTLSLKDGNGNTVQKSVQVPLPLVGTVTTILPSGFSSVTSDQAAIAADGRGATKLTYSITLLPPIGAAVTDIGWTAQASDIVIPAATINIAVVQPLKNPTLASAAKSYQGGATTGATLTAGAEQIDTNLLKLRDGASQLLSGLLQLKDGANQLNDGLANTAAPGAHQLATGAGTAANGASKLATGLSAAETGSAKLAGGLTTLAAGNARLAEGFNSSTGQADLVGGSQDLASGLGLISGGLASLAGVDGLPKAYGSALALRAGVDKILAGLGSPSTPGTILNGLAQLTAGNSQLQAGVTALTAGANGLASATTGLPAAKGGVDQVRQGIIDGGPPTAAAVAGIKGALAAVQGLGTCDATCQANLAGAQTGLDTLLAGLGTGSATAAGGLAQVSAGLATAIAGVGVGSTPSALTLRGGLAQVAGGLTASAAGLAQVTVGVNQVKGGLSNPACDGKNPTAATNPCGVREGLGLLADGLLSAVGGVTQLSAGATSAATGSGTLAEKIAEAGDGASQLAAGSRTAATGSSTLASGLAAAKSGSAALAAGNGKIAKGAGDLAVGLDAAASGSSKIAAGLGTAAAGAPALVDGAEQLSTKGTKKLAEGGNATALDFGERYAVLAAMADRTKDGALPFGAPANAASASAAYSFELAAASHEGSRNLTRGLLAIAALGIGALVSTVVRTKLF